MNPVPISNRFRKLIDAATSDWTSDFIEINRDGLFAISTDAEIHLARDTDIGKWVFLSGHKNSEEAEKKLEQVMAIAKQVGFRFTRTFKKGLYEDSLGFIATYHQIIAYGKLMDPGDELEWDFIFS